MLAKQHGPRTIPVRASKEQPMTLSASQTITATTISNYLKLNRCGRYLRFAIQPAERDAVQQRTKAQREPLSPLLEDFGHEIERTVIERLPGAVRDLNGHLPAETVSALRLLAPGAAAFFTQVALMGAIGGWPCEGRADILQATRRADGALELVVLDVKAATRDHVEYRLQVAFYLRLLRQMLDAADVAIASMAGGILRRDAEGALLAWDDPAARFDITPYDLVLDHLFVGPESDVGQISRMALADIPYALGPKCDGCTLNQLCMRESADRQDVALTPTITPADIQALKSAGIRTLSDLADLKRLPERGQGRLPLPITPGKEPIVATLAHNPLIADRLDQLVQRARAIRQRFDPATQSLPYILNSPFSQLPNTADHPDMVKIFLDAQHDYVQDRIYLTGALLVGPGGEQAFSYMCDAPPGDRDEAYVLLALLRDVVAALPTVAGTNEPFPFHIYLYDPFEQRVWLDALERHFTLLGSIPAFYDLLTSTNAVEELMFSFLAQEIRDRKNLDITCQNLYSVAMLQRFKWQDEQHTFSTLFRPRVFDRSEKRADGVWIETRSQFSSHIPLEYAYGAWHRLPTTRMNAATEAYRRCTRADLRAFEICRLRAMAHLEAWLNPGEHGHFAKEPHALPVVLADPDLPDYARALKEFLGLEHHTGLQAKLARFQLPLAQRAQTGRALPLRCISLATIQKKLIATFALDFAAMELSAEARAGVRIKEGDLMVLNPLDRQKPWEIVRGRVARVQRLDADTITLHLMDIFMKGSDFAYPHDTKLVPEVGTLYSLDEMADDLNADKYQLAVKHAEDNLLFAALDAEGAPAPEPPEPRGAAFLALAQKTVSMRPPTVAQAEVIAGHSTATVLLVQGPPGTGKTDTLGWAVLARLYARNAPTTRVLVCAKTHKATQLVLASIAEKYNALRKVKLGALWGDMQIVKLSSDEDEERPHPDVPLVNPRHGGRVRDLLAADAGTVIIGGTPGGMFTMMKTQHGKDLPWGNGPFDLLVIDEASQMGIPEAMLAAAFLAPGGRIIVVGDHRQMPPILAHAWPEERRRAALAFQPQRSIFEALLEKRIPRAGAPPTEPRPTLVQLDESFRLHVTQAHFLGEHIYQQDNIHFFSQQHHLLPAANFADPYVRAVLDPLYPVVVIEHGETGSQQVNPTELNLIAPLARACLEDLHLDGKTGLGIVVPHNAQKAALRQALPALDGAIDTVERFQGGEREVIIVSATASDPEYILAEASFLLDDRRLNVALSRPKRKLIVIASRALFRFLCADVPTFAHALIWKYLRYTYADSGLWTGTRAGVTVEVRGHHAGHVAAPTMPRQRQPDVVAMPPDDEPDRVAVLEERSQEEW
jgi:hypothetical protein